jgi:hypothetical protein
VGSYFADQGLLASEREILGMGTGKVNMSLRRAQRDPQLAD